MAIPTFQGLFNTFKAKFQEIKPTVDPSIKASWAGAFGKSVSAVGESIVIYALQLQKQFNPLTATGEFQQLWGSYDDLTLLGASPSIGTLRVYGVNSTVIPVNNNWVNQTNGLIYSNIASTTIAPQDVDSPSVSLITLTRIGSTVTAQSVTPHGLNDGEWIQMAGAIEVEYNALVAITNVSTYEFDYEIVGTPSTPATGSPFSASPIIICDSLTIESGLALFTTPFANQFRDQQFVQLNNVDGFSSLNGDKLITFVTATSFTVVTGESDTPLASLSSATVRSIHANVQLQSDVNGSDTVTPFDSLFDLENSITDVETTGKSIEGTQGGAEAETSDEFGARILLSRSSQEGIFTNDQITLSALLINGNTDVHIQNPDSDQIADPDPILSGQVRIYIVRGNDPIGPIPNGAILDVTKKSIIENGKLPAEMWQDDVQVLAPVLKIIDIAMTVVKPDTATMRTALKSQLNSFFEDSNLFGKDLDLDVLRGTVIQTKDLTAGTPEEAFIKSFEMIVGIGGSIDSVSDSAGLALFTMAVGSSVVLGDRVSLSGYSSATGYNGIHVVVFVSGSDFRVNVVPFTLDEDTGKFVKESLEIEKDELPQLGTLVVNNVEVL